MLFLLLDYIIIIRYSFSRITGCEFDRNEDSSHGAVVYVNSNVGSALSSVTVTSSRFTYNNAYNISSRVGGGIVLFELKIFYSHSLDHLLGIAVQQNSILTVRSSSFIGSQAAEGILFY